MIEEVIGNLSAAVHPLMEAAGSWTVGSLAKRESSATAATTTATCFTSTVVKEIDPSTSSRNCGRVCVACNTSKTPLWRGGPKGPKSLCNACGIKYRKARRALAAAAADAADSGGCFRQRNPGPFLILDDDGQELVTKPKKQYYRDLAVKYAGRGRPKKLAGISAYSTKCADLIGARDQYHKKMSSNSIGRSKPSAFHRVFPKDEEEAAMLLMALSGGLVFL